MFNLAHFLLETVYGVNAIVYHRTDVENLIELISRHGYKFGSGNMYGKGLYATYDLESQLNDRMYSIYGKYIVKLSVKVIDFLILDWDVFRRHPDFTHYSGITKHNFIDLQLKRYGIPIKHRITPDKYTSDTALKLINIIGKHNISNFVNGLIFIGRHDGKVMVIYHPERVAIPLSVSNNEGRTFIKVIDIKNSERFRNILKNRNIKHDFSKKTYLDVNLSKKDVKNGELIHDYSKDNIGHFIAVNLGLTTLKGAPKIVIGYFNCEENNLKTLEGGPKIVGGNFFCSKNILISLKGAPQKVGGDFNCARNQLMTLEGAPEEVDGYFNCTNNQLINLKGAPNKVGRNFYCNDNFLKTLEGAPEEVGGDFDCENNQLTTLKGAPRKVGGDFDCAHNQLTSLEGAPDKVDGNFNCYYNRLTTLEGAPEVISKNFNCSINKLKTLKGAPKKIGGNFICGDNQLTTLEGAPEEVGGSFICSGNPLTSLKGAPKKIGGNFIIKKSAKKFTEEEIRAICDVGGDVFT